MWGEGLRPVGRVVGREREGRPPALLLTAARVGLVEHVVVYQRRDVDQLRDLPERALRARTGAA